MTDKPAAYIFNGTLFWPDGLTTDQKTLARPLYDSALAQPVQGMVMVPAAELKLLRDQVYELRNKLKDLSELLSAASKGEAALDIPEFLRKGPDLAA